MVRTGGRPLTEQEFKALFFNGHGRAYLWAVQNPEFVTEDLLAEACLRDKTMLMEDSRDFYLEQFLDLIPFADSVLGRVWKRLVTNRWVNFGGSQSQLRWLAFRYAKRGNEHAKRALYKRVRKNMLEELTVNGFDRLLELDREKALNYFESLIDRDGGALSDRELGRMGYDIEEVFGKEWKDDWIKANCQTSRLAAVIRSEERAVYREPTGEKIQRVEDLLEVFRNDGDTRWAARSFASEATDEEFAKAAQCLPVPEEGLARYLRLVFMQRKWPIEPQPLFELAKSKDWKVACEAYRVMETIVSPEVRRFALAKLKNRYQGRLACDVLIENYRPGDEALIRKRADGSRRRHEMHDILKSLKQMIEKHPEIGNDYVQYLYDTMPCSFCRYYIVKVMMDRDMVTDEVRAECLHDAAEDTRLLFCGAAA